MSRADEPVFKEATAISTGRLGIWCFLASEFVIFGGLIAIYLLFRWRHPEWSADAAHMLTAVGAINTVILLASGRTMFLAHAAVERGADGDKLKAFARENSWANTAKGIESLIRNYLDGETV